MKIFKLPNTLGLAFLMSLCQGSFAQTEGEDEPNYRDQVQIMYVAYYGRPGDAGGLDFWATELEKVNGNLSRIINNFGNSMEFTERFGDLDDEELVNNIFLQLFGRDADSGGLNFYVNALREGRFTLASIALNVADGTQNRDEMIKANKLRAANAFSEAYVEAGADYGEFQIDDAKLWLGEVDSTEASVTAALDRLPDLLEMFSGGMHNTGDMDGDNDGISDIDDPCPLDGADTCDDTTSVVSLEISDTMPLTSIGETIQLAVTTHMRDGSSQAIASAFVHWVSSDPAVATVIDGTVTAVGPGNAKIVATYQGQKAVVEVSVHISVRETGTVRVIYAAPSDREFRSDYREAIQHAIVDLQSWYRRQLGGQTFSLYDATPEQCQLSGNHDDYDSGDVWAKILEGVQHCAAVGHGSAEFVWVLYVAVKEECGEEHELGRGGSGVTMLQAAEGDFDLGPYYYCDEGPYERTSGGVIGGLGHELGHALGLLHPPGCDEGLPTCDYDALMDTGYTTYPNTYLRPDDKQVLWRSPFIEKNPE